MAAIFGAILWTALLFQLLEPIERLLLIGPLIIVPLGLGLAGSSGRLERRLQPIAAGIAALSFLFEPGTVAAALALPWLAETMLIAANVLKRPRRPASELCISTALLYLPVGAGWLVLSRYGAAPLGFPAVIVLLTAVHFHFAAFAAPILAGLTGRSLGPSRIFPFIAAGVVASPALLAAGITLSPIIEFAGAVLLAASLFALAVLGLRFVIPRAKSRAACALLALSYLSAFAGTGLAVTYALGNFVEKVYLEIPDMARWHGSIMAVGFSLAGLLGWNQQPLHTSSKVE